MTLLRTGAGCLGGILGAIVGLIVGGLLASHFYPAPTEQESIHKVLFLISWPIHLAFYLGGLAVSGILGAILGTLFFSNIGKKPTAVNAQEEITQLKRRLAELESDSPPPE
jgi:MFS family permease